MGEIHLQDGYFELPEVGFVDRTVHVFEAPIGGDDELGLLVCRSVFPAGKSLREVVTAHVKHEGARLAGYAVLDEREGMVAGVPAIEIFARFRHEGGLVYQRQAHLAAPGTWLFFASSAPYARRDGCDAVMDAVLETFVLRELG